MFRALDKLNKKTLCCLQSLEPWGSVNFIKSEKEYCLLFLLRNWPTISYHLSGMQCLDCSSRFHLNFFSAFCFPFLFLENKRWDLVTRVGGEIFLNKMPIACFIFLFIHHILFGLLQHSSPLSSSWQSALPLLPLA